MTEAVAIIAVGTLVGFVLFRGHATRILHQLRLDYANLVAEERHLRVELEQAVVLRAGAERRRDQTQSDCQKLTIEMDEMATQIEEIEGQLKRPGDEGEDDEQGDESQAPDPDVP